MILVTNDDGIHSKGIIVLAKALQEIGDVFTVAPDIEQEAKGSGRNIQHGGNDREDT